LAQKITEIDAAIITHDHADHLHGIDDLRPFCFRTPLKRIPLFTYEKCAQEMRQRFQYIFNPPAKKMGGGIPLLDLNQINPEEWVSIEGLDFYFDLLPHGNTQTLSFYVDGFCYIVDCQKISDSYLAWLKKREVKLLLIDCLKDAPHDTHLNYQQAIQGIKDIAPTRAALLHLSHDFDHESLENRLRQESLNHVQVGFDGLRLKI
jgi:phosphoribosyl 1,2-cyclic phosphate phosphodiesterase